MTALEEDWEYVRFEVDEIRDEGEQVLALARFHALGRASKVEFDYPIGIILTVERGLVVYGRFYSDAREAIEAAGQ